MITQRDMDKILTDVNRVLENLSNRIEVLEKQAEAKATTTASKKSQ